MKIKALRIREPGGPDVLEIGEVGIPEPGPSEVLVEVAAAGLNRADCLQRRGVYPAPPGALADVPGLEFAGKVAQAGPGSGWSTGDRVMGIIGGGGMASHVVVHGRELVEVPKGVDLIQAAAIPEVFMTSYDALFRQAQVGLGSRVLVHAIASGIGTAALQLIRSAGGTTIGTSRSADKLARCEELGLEHGIDTSSGSFGDALKEIAPEGVDVILDTIGAKYLQENMKRIALKGTIVVIGLIGGATGELSLGLLLRKRATIRGSVLRSRPLEEKAALAQAFRHDVLPLFESGALKPVIDEVIPMKNASEAHRRMEASQTFGKLVLSWNA